jgi:hypothetical protein
MLEQQLLHLRQGRQLRGRSLIRGQAGERRRLDTASPPADRMPAPRNAACLRARRHASDRLRASPSGPRRSPFQGADGREYFRRASSIWPVSFRRATATVRVPASAVMIRHGHARSCWLSKPHDQRRRRACCSRPARRRREDGPRAPPPGNRPTSRQTPAGRRGRIGSVRAAARTIGGFPGKRANRRSERTHHDPNRPHSQRSTRAPETAGSYPNSAE